MAAECDVLSEIEVLQSIYLDELMVNEREDGGWEVSLVLYPSTAQDSVSQFVRLTLTLSLDQQYPSSSPIISIHNPRGLSDDKLSSVQKVLQSEAQSCLGSPVLYQLIEKAKEILTDSNIPHGNCVICLYDFKEGEAFTKTSCYHYFHSHCLGRYASHSERELQQREKELEEDKTRDRTEHQELTVVCPVCREALSYDVQQLLACPAPQLPEVDEAAIGSDFQLRWFELQKLLEKQRAKGGIIDPEVESNRFLIHINEPPAVVENGNQDVDSGTTLPSASNDETGVDTFVPSVPHCRGGQGSRRRSYGRGPRGGRYRPQRVTEQLDKLSLCSVEAPKHAKAQAQYSQQTNADGCAPAASCQAAAVADVGQSQAAASPVDHPQCRSGSEVNSTKDAVDSRGQRGGRRRGPQRSAAPGPGRYHWDGRAPRSRGGANNMCCRGEGPRRGPGRGHQHNMERGREEVL